jgi:trimeric autotransporter adhesin
MRSISVPRPSPALIVALIALFVGMSTTGYAAVRLAANSVTSAKIKNGQVKTADLGNDAVTAAKLARKAVETESLVDEAVTTPKLDAGAVTTDRLGDSAVTTPKLANGAVSSDKIADGSVTKAKLAKGAGPLFAVIEANGTKARASAEFVSSTRVTTGSYEVQFDRPVNNCAYGVQQAGSTTGVSIGFASAVRRSGKDNGVFVRTTTIAGAAADRPFHLMVTC